VVAEQLSSWSRWRLVTDGSLLMSVKSVKPITLYKHSTWYAENFSPAHYAHSARYKVMENGALANLSTERWFVWPACRGSDWKPLPIAMHAANNLRAVVGHSYSCAPKQSNSRMMSNNTDSSQVLNHKTVLIVWHDTATEFEYCLLIKGPPTHIWHT